MYESVAAVRLELPFLLRLPPKGFLCWEPREGVGAIHPQADVGELTWCRRSVMLRPEHLGIRVVPEDPKALPLHDYQIRPHLETGESLYLGSLKGGPDGGFSEPRPYTTATIFLCLRVRAEAGQDATLKRAVEAINNIIALYRFMVMDPLARPIRGHLDAIYAVVSRADLPTELRGLPAQDVLSHAPGLPYGSTIGKDRFHHVGMNSRDDVLHPLSMPDEGVAQFANLIQNRCEVELFHELFISALRRCRRAEHALAVVDAQSAFEVFVATALRDALKSEGKADDDVDTMFAAGGRLHLLQRRLREIDAVVARRAGSGAIPRTFLGSAAETCWRSDLYGLRNRIAHGGVRDVTFDQAKLGIAAGLKAVAAIESLDPMIKRKLSWPAPLLDLAWLTEMPGSLFRLFH